MVEAEGPRPPMTNLEMWKRVYISNVHFYVRLGLLPGSDDYVR